MSLYERYKNNLYELQFNEVEYKNDILTLEAGQYVNEAGELVTVPKIEGTRVEWNWETHEWEEKATNLEVVQSQYSEYEGMDTPSTLEEMRLQDPSLATEYLKETHEWEEKATNLEVVQSQYSEYEGMDTPSTLEEMRLQDPSLATEYLNMMIELRGLIYTLSVSGTQSVGYAAIQLPVPSEKLKQFKDKFKRI